MKRILAAVVLIGVFSCNNKDDDRKVEDPSLVPPTSNIPAPVTMNFDIISQYPHDTSAYTQGLELHNGKMYEATGDNENSSLRITDHKTGKVIQKHMMGAADIFGEGITILNGKIYQLTWESNKVYVYDVNNITKPVKTFEWPDQGWGITNNGKDLIVSTGSSNLYIVDPETFKIKNTIAVQTNKGPLDNLNELEYVNGVVYANIYTTNIIVKIDLESGHVLGVLYFPENFRQEELAKNPRTDYFNGIAYDSTSKSFFVTGKRWSRMFELKIN